MKNLITLFFLLLSIISKASDLEISKPILYIEGETAYTGFNLSWDNAWNNEKNHDAIWLFFKIVDVEFNCSHVSILPEGHEVISSFTEDNPNLGFEISEDFAGLYIYPQDLFRGKISVSLKIKLDLDSFEGINTHGAKLNVLGFEMVHIPGGPFKLGDPGSEAIGLGGFYAPNSLDNQNGYIEINSTNQKLEVSENGALFYKAKAPNEYEGDQEGIVPESFPNGFAPFYIMKYEIMEGQYVSFLNTISPNQLASRVVSQEERYYSAGGTITEKGGYYFTDFPNKPCQFLGWDDVMALADWAGLRPMTEFEFTKAARGPGNPIANDFPWGTAEKLQIQRLPNENGVLVMVNGWDESKLNEETRKYFGASYYWVMDLSGSLWERVITIGHEKGRAFLGTHGDGTLSDEGFANVVDWPIEEKDSGGIGFRGGGFYGYDRSYHNYNPFSPIAYRPYGGWHGGMRTDAYGTRLVRTAN